MLKKNICIIISVEIHKSFYLKNILAFLKIWINLNLTARMEAEPETNMNPEHLKSIGPEPEPQPNE